MIPVPERSQPVLNQFEVLFIRLQDPDYLMFQIHPNVLILKNFHPNPTPEIFPEKAIMDFPKIFPVNATMNSLQKNLLSKILSESNSL